MLFRLSGLGSLALAYYYALGYGKLGFMTNWCGKTPVWTQPIRCTKMRTFAFRKGREVRACYSFFLGKKNMARLTFTGRPLPNFWIRCMAARLIKDINLFNLETVRLMQVEFRPHDEDGFTELNCYELVGAK